MNTIEIHENGIYMEWGVTDENRLVLLYLGTTPFVPENYAGADIKEFSPVEISVSGLNCPEDRLGNEMIHSSLGVLLEYAGYEKINNENGSLYCFRTKDDLTKLSVSLFCQFYTGIPAFRMWTVIRNEGTVPQGIESCTSFSLHGFDRHGDLPYEDKLYVNIIHNGWQKELSWRTCSLPELGLSRSQRPERVNSSKIVSFSNTGAWSSKEYLPLAVLENRETDEYLGWQIENNGSWHWEIGEHAGCLYLKLAGPTELYAHWYKVLKRGESFTSVPAGIVCGKGTAEDAAVVLTQYRRRIRRKNDDDEKLPVIFNDYMNCLFGNPSTIKEIPLIDAAAAAGCEYYCIDCGWYSDGAWWNSVGEWIPSRARFPGGLRYVMEYIRRKGMIPGLWLEIEVMGMQCKAASQLPDECFFIRHGKRVCDKSRYQLDFRSMIVRKRATEIVKRLVEEYGAGYIKMDYNIEPGIGTEYDADSPGDGLLGHARAYLSWLETILEMYPSLVIENCSSGGMRIDYAMLSGCSIQSTSDMEDYIMYSTIAANAPLALAPEQAAVWSYPMKDGDKEETIFNMVNVLMLRIHQSGYLFALDDERKNLVKEAVCYYKEIREDRKCALPFWPLGFSSYSDAWAALALEGRNKTYLAVWKRGGSSRFCSLPLERYKEKEISIRCAYPSSEECPFEWNSSSGNLTVEFVKPVMARFFEIDRGEQ
ncbi:MAG TPA: alpha-galactosidase [Treponema sp.]|nr:alpha-galactosidase [Treponema sp.]